MSGSVRHISVCICTFRRAELLKRLLTELERQQTNGQFTFSVVVADNDRGESARPVVTEFAKHSKIAAVYCCEPRQNIAAARNKVIENSTGDFIAFIDDDEFPVPEWLRTMLAACEKYEAAWMLGPVRPHFDAPPPRWIIAGRFCERPEHPTGRVMDWEECRTGNVLFRRELVAGQAEPFKLEFDNGGEDKDFFMRMTQSGHVFRWCNEGVTYEVVPPDRWTRSYMLRRALLRGKNVLKHPIGRGRVLVTAAIAVPIYALVLLPALVLGQHWFMKYCIRFCDHLGRLLAVARINPVNER